MGTCIQWSGYRLVPVDVFIVSSSSGDNYDSTTEHTMLPLNLRALLTQIGRARLTPHTCLYKTSCPH